MRPRTRVQVAITLDHFDHVRLRWRLLLSGAVAKVLQHEVVQRGVDALRGAEDVEIGKRDQLADNLNVDDGAGHGGDRGASGNDLQDERDQERCRPLHVHGHEADAGGEHVHDEKDEEERRRLTEGIRDGALGEDEQSACDWRADVQHQLHEQQHLQQALCPCTGAE